jgi:alkylation response protein AidB-like acyl-CoA dehydrogenase
MEWVIALLAVGCVFFAAQVIVDYLRYRRAIEPRLDRADEAKQDLRERIAVAEAELAATRSELNPARREVLETEYNELHERVKQETDRQRSGAPPPLEAE